MVDFFRKMFRLVLRVQDEETPMVFGCTGEECTSLNVREGNVKYQRGEQYDEVDISSLGPAPSI